MTKRELNRDWKRLYKKVMIALDRDYEYSNNDDFNNYKAEFNRLFNADRTFKDVNKDNILRLLTLNRKLNFVTPFRLTLWIDDKKL